MLQNLHTHTNLCDGKNSPREMVQKAIELGFDSLGFSAHAPSLFYCGETVEKNHGLYIAEIRRLKEEYKGKINIYLGIELDRYSYNMVDLANYEYTIASVHHAAIDGYDVAFDKSPEASRKAICEVFGNDNMRFAKAYFDTLLELPRYIKGDILGHFDVLTKFKEKAPDIVDDENPEYRKMALETLHALRGSYEFFEVNTGAMGRGHRHDPYPASFILKEMKSLNCKLLITSDCHDANYLDCGFGMARELVRSHGFTELYYLTDNGFVAGNI